MDPITGRIACHINSVTVVSAGQNVDGFWQEYTYGLLQPVYSRTSTSDNFYMDTAVLDLGILTNTGKK